MRFPRTAKELRRSLGNLLSISRNRLAGRTFVPDPRHAICIETSARCNLACRFCAYPKRGPGGFMPMTLFSDAVSQALDLGFKEFWLTPMLGEVFADPGWREKFEYLETANGVRSFNFFSNLILPPPDAVAQLHRFSKLSELHVSIYGHDPETFEQVTAKPTSQYDRLVRNLAALDESLGRRRPGNGLHFSIRTSGIASPAELPDNDMVAALRGFENRWGASLILSTDYDNWGGTIADDEIRDLGISLTDGKSLYMFGACSVLFSMPQIGADGAVRACACRDVDGSLTLGNLRDRPLGRLHSWANPRFRAIVDAQQRGTFTDNCRSCSMYRSIYDHRSSGPNGRWATSPLERAVKSME